MAATLRELLIKVGFDVKKEALDRADASVLNLRKSVMWLATGIAAASTALIGLVYSASKVGAEIEHISEITGLSTRQIQQFKGAADLSNVGFENLTRGLKFFGRVVGEALNGQKAYVQYLKEAGITTLRDQNGQIKSQSELLKEVAEKIKNTATVQQKLVIMQDLFSRSGINMLSFLNKGAAGIDKNMQAMEDYGYILSDTDIKASKLFDTQRKELMMFVGGVKNAIGESLIPMFNKLLARLLELIKINKNLIIQKLDKFFQGLAAVIKSVGLALYTFGRIINNLVKSTIGWNNVLRIAGVLLGLLITNTIINSVKLLYTWILRLAKSFGALDIAASSWSITLALIGAAFYLAWDDLKNFEAGNESLIGTLQKSHPIIANFVRVLGGLVSFLKNLIVGTVDSIIDILKLFIKVSVWLDKKLAKIPIIGKIFKKMGDEMEHPAKIVNDILKQTADNLDEINKATDPSKIRLGAQPGYKYFLQSQAAGGGKATNVTSNVDVNITVPAGTSKDQQDWFTRAAKEHFGNSMQDQIKSVLLASPLHE